MVVPRLPRLGEHVDNHQVVFTRRLAAAGGAFLAESQALLHKLLDRAVAEPAAFQAPVQERGLEGAVRSFERLVGDLVPGGRTVPSRRAGTESDGAAQ